MGIACIIPNVSFYASPLLSLAKVVRTKSTASLSLPLTLSSFACAFFWSLFGVGVQDPFVLLPNVCSPSLLFIYGFIYTYLSFIFIYISFILIFSSAAGSGMQHDPACPVWVLRRVHEEHWQQLCSNLQETDGQ